MAVSDIDDTIPKANDPLRAQPIRENFAHIKAALAAGGGGQVQVHFAVNDTGIIAAFAPGPIPNGVLWFDSGLTQLKIRIGTNWLNVG